MLRHDETASVTARSVGTRGPAVVAKALDETFDANTRLDNLDDPSIFAKRWLVLRLEAELLRYAIEDDHLDDIADELHAADAALRALKTHDRWHGDDTCRIERFLEALRAIAEKDEFELCWAQLNDSFPIIGRLAPPGKDFLVSKRKLPFVPILDDALAIPAYLTAINDAFAERLLTLSRDHKITCLCFMEKAVGPIGALSFLSGIAERLGMPACLYRESHWPTRTRLAGYRPTRRDRIALVYDLAVTGGGLVAPATDITNQTHASVPLGVVFFSYMNVPAVLGGPQPIHLDALGWYHRFQRDIIHARRDLAAGRSVHSKRITILTNGKGSSVPPARIGGTGFSAGASNVQIPEQVGDEEGGMMGRKRELSGVNGGHDSEPPTRGQALAELDRLEVLVRELVTIDTRLRRLRSGLGLSQDAFARLIEYPANTVWSWERGRKEPRIRSLQHIVERLRQKQTSL